MSWLKAMTQKIPSWASAAITLFTLFLLLALGLPRIVKLFLILSQPGISTLIKNNPALTPAPMPVPVHPPACTAVGQQWISPVDGMIELCIPAGNFLMGSSAAVPEAVANEKPQHTVALDAFWIDKTDVTNSQYALCVASGGCKVPIAIYTHTHASYFGNAYFRNFPVVDVTWNEANQYCDWAYRNLPSEAEWEKAARGIDGRLYPWGNASPDAHLLNFNSSLNDTSAVCQFPAGNSPYGVCDMAGNVWQWVGDWYAGRDYSAAVTANPKGPASGNYKAFRGSQWGSPDWAVRSSIRRWRLPNLWSYAMGFRCAAASP